MLSAAFLLFGASLFCHCDFLETIPLEEVLVPRNVSEILKNTRRILRGNDVGDTRPYMVYLRPAPHATSTVQDPTWLCGGVIIHERYILTSAACIEQAQHFYVVSGTNKWVPGNETNNCIKYGAKKAIWKCVPQSYVFDGNEYDNIRWMIGDIAVVKVEDEFNFKRRVKGCDYVPKKIAYNNQSVEYEKHGTLASTAGWGSQDSFSDDLRSGAAAQNSEKLLEADVLIVSKKNCKRRWPDRYHYIIDEHMICGKDGLDSDTMSSVCLQNEVNCKELAYSDEYDEDTAQRSRKAPMLFVDPDKNYLEARRVGTKDKPFQEIIKDDARRTKANKITSSGFCENDHGGPLVVGYGMTSMVVGVISACQTHKISRKCFGPFLYTSVFKYRNLITCAIDKEIGATCRKYLRSAVQTSFDWVQHPDGPAKEVIKEDIAVNDKVAEKPAERSFEPKRDIKNDTQKNTSNTMEVIKKILS